MQENKILYSDSSYSHETKTASISVYDVTQNKYDSRVFKDVKNVLVAETMALRYSISLAITREYDNVVFIYDNLTINVEDLKNEYKDFFKIIQFVWLKREFLTKVDSCAKKALQDCFKSEKANQQNSTVKQNSIEDTIKAYRELPVIQLIEIFKQKVFNKHEAIIIDNWKNQVFDEKAICNSKINFARYGIFYYLLRKSKMKENFYQTLKFYYPKIEAFEEFKAGELPLEEVAKLLAKNKKIKL